ncbi:MAG: hypothetical protein LBB38_02095 [Puniceicoccales bacterium]|nr:hypothetical protein [Puniceicoccales bacterium]
MDIAQHIAGHLVTQIGEDGRVSELGDADPSVGLQPGPIAHALASCAAAMGSGEACAQLADGAARSIAGQFYHHSRGDCMVGCARGAIALMALGLNRSRNGAWAKFPDSIRDRITRWMRTKEDVPLQLRPYAIVRSIVASGMGFVSTDDSEKLVEDYLKELLASPAAGFVDCSAMDQLQGRYDASGLMGLLLVREALQRHANSHIRERRLHDLRSCMARYLRILPYLLQRDGSSWAYGEPSGCLGTVCSCSAILCALADGWIDPVQRESQIALLGRHFRNFFFNHFDSETGNIILPAAAVGHHSSGFSQVGIAAEVVHQLALWHQFGKNVRDTFSAGTEVNVAEGGRFVSFESGSKYDRGLMIYGCGNGGPSFQLPLLSPPREECGVARNKSAAFPHCAGILDASIEWDVPPLLPLLTVGGKTIAPSFYGKNIATGLGASRSFQFRYEQPEVISIDGELLPGFGSCKVQWSFNGNEMRLEYVFVPKKVARMERFCYAVPIPAADGEMSLRAKILHDDFHGEWEDGDDSPIRGPFAPMSHYTRTTPILLQVDNSYRFSVAVDMIPSDEGK